MTHAFRKLTQGCAILVLSGFAAASFAASDAPKPKVNAGSDATTKAEKCAKLKRRIADYEAATAKGGKGSNPETIKSDIAWVKDNCK